MPGTVPTGVGQTIFTPPLALLDVVLDEHGPYGEGSHTITDFLTTSAHGLLPAGTWPIGGTYGVVIVATTIPPTWGYALGYDSGGPIGAEGTRYHNRFAQVCIQHQVLGGAFVTVQLEDCHFVQTFIRTEWIPLGGDRFGLHVSPDIAVDVYFMCLLA
jgi:hypothetical protein